MFKKDLKIKVYLHPNLKDIKKVKIKATSTVAEMIRLASKKFKIDNPLQYSLSILESPGSIAQELDDILYYSDIRLQWPGETLFMLSRNRSNSIRASTSVIPSSNSSTTMNRPQSITMSHSTPALTDRQLHQQYSAVSSDLYPNLDGSQPLPHSLPHHHLLLQQQTSSSGTIDRRLSTSIGGVVAGNGGIYPSASASGSSNSQLDLYAYAFNQQTQQQHQVNQSDSFSSFQSGLPSFTEEPTYSIMIGCSLRLPGTNTAASSSILRSNSSLVDASNALLFESSARESAASQLIDCSFESSVIASVQEFIKQKEQRDTSLSQIAEAQWVEQLAKSQGQQQQQPKQLSQSQLSQSQLFQPQLSQPQLSQPQQQLVQTQSIPTTTLSASLTNLYTASPLLQPQQTSTPPPYIPMLPDIIHQSPELRHLCSVERFDVSRVLAAINELGTTEAPKIKSFVEEWTAFEAMGFSPSLVRTVIGMYQDTETRLSTLEIAQQLTDSGFSDSEIFSALQLLPKAQEAKQFLQYSRMLIQRGYAPTAAKEALLMNALNFDDALKELGPLR